jgi:uncharacterized protein YukE
MTSYQDLMRVNPPAIGQVAENWAQAAKLAGQRANDVNEEWPRLGDAWTGNTSARAQRRFELLANDLEQPAHAANRVVTILRNLANELEQAKYRLENLAESAAGQGLVVKATGEVTAADPGQQDAANTLQASINATVASATAADYHAASELETGPGLELIKAYQAAKRQEAVERAYRALSQSREFRLVAGGPIQHSRPDLVHEFNLLGVGNSNTNLNEFNHYRTDAKGRGLDWCAFTTANFWDGQNTPSGNMAASQAWRDQAQVGGRFNPYDLPIPQAPTPPQPADVLVWTNNSDHTHGHVEMVVDYNPVTQEVTTVGGNTGHGNDSIERHTYKWTGDGPAIHGKTFRGYTSRF